MKICAICGHRIVGNHHAARELRFGAEKFFARRANLNCLFYGLNTDFQSQDIILPAAAIESFNPEPGTAANSGGPTALVDSTGRLAVGSGLNNL